MIIDECAILRLSSPALGLGADFHVEVIKGVSCSVPAERAGWENAPIVYNGSAAVLKNVLFSLLSLMILIPERRFPPFPPLSGRDVGCFRRCKVGGNGARGGIACFC